MNPAQLCPPAEPERAPGDAAALQPAQGRHRAAVDMREVHCQRTGTRNLRCGIGCQDVVMCREAGPLTFFGLADGQTGKRCCVTGAEESLRVLYRFFRENTIEELSGYRYTDELRYQIIRLIRERLEQLSRSREEGMSEFASTVVVLAIDRASGAYMAVHLGDGCIIGVRSDGEVGYISGPDCGLTRGYTWFTSSRDALCHLRIVFGNIRCYRRAVLATDGAGRLHRGRQIPGKAVKLLSCAGKAEDILAYAAGGETGDDMSCVVVEVGRAR